MNRGGRKTYAKGVKGGQEKLPTEGEVNDREREECTTEGSNK